MSMRHRPSSAFRLQNFTSGALSSCSSSLVRLPVWASMSRCGQALFPMKSNADTGLSIAHLLYLCCVVCLLVCVCMCACVRVCVCVSVFACFSLDLSTSLSLSLRLPPRAVFSPFLPSSLPPFLPSSLPPLTLNPFNRFSQVCGRLPDGSCFTNWSEFDTIVPEEGLWLDAASDEEEGESAAETVAAVHFARARTRSDPLNDRSPSRNTARVNVNARRSRDQGVKVEGMVSWDSEAELHSKSAEAVTGARPAATADARDNQQHKQRQHPVGRQQSQKRQSVHNRDQLKQGKVSSTGSTRHRHSDAQKHDRRNNASDDDDEDEWGDDKPAPLKRHSIFRSFTASGNEDARQNGIMLRGSDAGRVEEV